MTDPTPDGPTPGSPTPDGAVPIRSPHSISVHVLVDAAISFLAIVFLGLIVGASIGVIIAIAIVAGCGLAPFTRRTELRQLAARAEDDAEDGS